MRNRATLIVAILALVASVSALYLDYKHFELQKTQHVEAMEADKGILDKAIDADKELLDKAIDADKELLDKAIDADKELLDKAIKADQQQAEHTELSFSLEMLRDSLTSQGDWLNDIDPRIRMVAERYYNTATDNFSKAKKERMARNFELVRELIAAADVCREDCYAKAYKAAEELGIDMPPKPVWIGEEGETY